ncbi:hypothetical protein ANN_10864 [Periplaneta americana]|uniref:Uncharacterized protein n=1 Tax=Periplaneta americana TaxID=6978 RepID=A0ABQ8T5R3_PERAM|nr:hypothetical protein ANN_10864 [Periplaneta americana]
MTGLCEGGNEPPDRTIAEDALLWVVQHLVSSEEYLSLFIVLYVVTLFIMGKYWAGVVRKMRQEEFSGGHSVAYLLV